jgi:hypothetical protein
VRSDTQKHSTEQEALRFAVMIAKRAWFGCDQTDAKDIGSGGVGVEGNAKTLGAKLLGTQDVQEAKQSDGL